MKIFSWLKMFQFVSSDFSHSKWMKSMMAFLPCENQGHIS